MIQVGISARSAARAVRHLEELRRELRRYRVPRRRDPRVRVKSVPRTVDGMLCHASALADIAMRDARLGHHERMFYLLGLVQGAAVADSEEDAISEIMKEQRLRRGR